MEDSFEPLRLGLLSTAAINDWILDAVRDSELVEVVAVGSRSEERARAYALERGIPRAHGSYEALLSDPAVDAVYVCTWTSEHPRLVAAAVERGLPVFCEKPLATTIVRKNDPAPSDPAATAST